MARKESSTLQNVLVKGLSVLFLLLTFTPPSYSIPLFARRYGKSCFTCHVSEPMLNEFGRRFQANGYQIPFAKPTVPIWDQLPSVLAFAISPSVTYTNTKDNLSNESSNATQFDEYGVDLLTAGNFSNRVSWYGDLTVDPAEGAGVESLFLTYHAGDINFAMGKQILRTLFPIQFTPAFSTDYLTQSYDPYSVAGLDGGTGGMPKVGANPLLIEEASYAVSAFGWVPEMLDGFRYEAAFTSGDAGVELSDNHAVFLSADQTIFYANNAPFRIGAWYYGGKQTIEPTTVSSGATIQPTDSPSRFGVGVDIYDPWIKKIDLMAQYMTAKDDNIFNGSNFAEQKMNGTFVALAAILVPEKFYLYGRWDHFRVDLLDFTEDQYTLVARYHFVPNVYLYGELGLDSQTLNKPNGIVSAADTKTTIFSLGTTFAY